MPEQPSPFADIPHSWTDAERDVWSAWSDAEQDVSQTPSAAGFASLLDPLERSMHGMARLQASMLRTSCELVSANPLVPEQARSMVAQTCGRLVGLSELQQHLLHGWFGMTRQFLQMSRRTR